MKIRVSFIVVAAMLLGCGLMSGQMRMMPGSQTRAIKWIDDTHLLIQSPGEKGETIFKSYDCKTGDATLLPDYKNEMDMLRDALPDDIETGMNTAVSSDMKAVAFTRNNDLFFFRVGDTGPRQLTKDNAPEVNARFSPDDAKIAYTKNRDLYVFDIANDKETRLTDDATDRIYNGWASWVYYEEILGRPSRYAAFWWSPDGGAIAFFHTDDRPVPVFNIVGLEDTDGLHGRMESTPYPKPGDPNPIVKIGIADLKSGKTIWVKTDETVDQYFNAPLWTPDSKKLMVQVVNRDQNDLRIILAEAATGSFSEIYRETRPTWVDFFEDIYIMNDGSGFILRSCRGDWHNLYYYGWNGTMKSALTDFDWKVNSVEEVDEKNRILYFSGTGPDALQNHLYRVRLDGSKLQQITSGQGTHSVLISPAGSFFADTWSNINDPGGIALIDRKGKTVRNIYREKLPVFDPEKNARSEIVRVRTSDGLFDMPVLITYPVNFDATRKHPVIFTVYGGPDSESVFDRWVSITPRWYAENGIVTVSVDHRGSGKFGKKGLDYMHRNLGKWEISDYSDVVKWLREKPWADSERMGISGGSYGGYVTCLALTKGADFWTHGIADYSVTDYRLYDNIYTERFMDTPADNPEGYDSTSVITYADRLKGKLLLRHGDMDDNVHMQNSIWLITKLQDLNKPFEFMVYPGERHGWGGPKRTFMTSEGNKFWLRNFFGK